MSTPLIAPNAHCWLVRAGHGGEHIGAFVAEGFVSLGFARSGVGDLRDLDDRAIERRMADIGRGYPAADRRELVALRDMEVGDVIVTVDPGRRDVVVGVVDGDYAYTEEPIVGDHRHHRRVRWLARWPKEGLPSGLDRDLSWGRTVRSLPDQHGWHDLAVRAAEGEGDAPLP